MVTPKPVSAGEAQLVAQSILRRRREQGDEHADLLADVTGEPVQVLTYLRQHPHRMSAAAAEAEVLDAARLGVRLEWQAIEHWHWIFSQADRHKVRAKRVGEILGISTITGVTDRKRLTREKMARLNASIAAAAEVGEPDDRRAEWVAAHQRQLLSLARVLTDARHTALADDDTYEDLVVLAHACADGAITVGNWVEMSTLVPTFRSVTAVAALPANHPLTVALSTTAALATDYRRATRRTPPDPSTARVDEGGRHG